MGRGVASSTLIALALAATVCAPGAQDALARRVLTTNAGEFQPARGGEYLAWERNTRARPDHYSVLARRIGGRKFRVNPRGTQAANGGIDGTMLVYQQFRKRRSDIKLFDLARRRRRNPPKGVNTRHWEYWPSISGRWLLFGRYKRGGNRKLLLKDLRTGATRVLAKSTSKHAFLAPGQVNGAWVAYAKCTPTTRCDVYRYNVFTGFKSKVPNPGMYQRAPSVSASGTVYFVRTRRRCGRSVRLVRHAVGTPPKIVLRVRPGVDVGDTYVFSNATRPNRVLFDRRRCGRPAGANIHERKQPRLLALKARIEGAGGGTVASRPSGISCGANCVHSFVAGISVTLVALPERNSNFTGWGGACSGSQRTCVTTVQAGKRVIAFFDPASSFSLSVLKRGSGRGRVTSRPAGIDCGGDCWETYRAGTAVTLSATAAAGSRFTGWSGACAGTGKCTVTMDRVRSVTATFTRQTTATTATRLYPDYIAGHGSAPSEPGL